MNVLILSLVLIVEQYLPGVAWRARIQSGFNRYLGYWQHHFDGGQYHQGVVAWLLAISLPVSLIYLIYVLLGYAHPLLAEIWNGLVVYCMVGIRAFSRPFSKIMQALQAEDLPLARSLLQEWQGGVLSKPNELAGVELTSNEIIKLSIERGLQESHHHIWGGLFWFAILPGPLGPLLYRCMHDAARIWRTPLDISPSEVVDSLSPSQIFSTFARQAFMVFDWIPVRLTALSFAIVGNFEDAIYCWRTQAKDWPSLPEGILLATGAGALGIRLGEPLRSFDGALIERPEVGLTEPPQIAHMHSAVGLLWRTLVFWLFLMLFLVLLRLQ